MALNILEVTALSVFDNFIKFPKYNLQYSFEKYCNLFQQNKATYPIGYIGGQVLLNKLLNGELTPFEIQNDLDPLAINSPTLSLFKETATSYVHNAKAIFQREDLFAWNFPAMQKRLAWAEEFPNNIKSDMSKSEKILFTNKVLDAHLKIEHLNL